MHDVVLTVFALTALLGLVSLLLPLAERLSIPYAVLLAAVGCAIGGLTYVVGDGGGAGMAGDVVRALGRFNLTAEAFLYIFLPALLFETAINVDVRQLLDEIAPVLLLAVVGVLVSTLIVGLALWGASGVSLLACLMLGAILATTDPVAVVAIFRDIGAPRRLSMLVEGESLFNDAAAIALFSLLVAMLTGAREANPLGALGEFFEDFAGGLLFGLLAGRFACALLPVLRDHRLAETTLTVALAYLAFVIGDHYLGISGVVATVTAGLVLSYEGRRRLSPSSWESLKRSWEEVAFWASSLIFLLAAMMVPATLATAGWREFLLLAVVVLAAILARALTLWGLLPLLSAAGLAERVSNDYRLVVLWGGMRGAVSLALALAATENTLLAPEIRQFIGVLATGFVLFTLFVMAPTLRPLMRFLRLDVLSPAEVALRDRVVGLSLSTIGDELGGIAAGHGIPEEVTRKPVERYRRHIHAVAELAEENAQIAPESRLMSSLGILVEREQEFYLAYFEARTMSRRAISTVLSQVARLREAVKAGSADGYRAAAQRMLAFRRGFRICVLLQRWLRLERPLARELADRFEVLLARRLVVGELIRFNDRELKRLFGAGIAETVAGELTARLAGIDQAVSALLLQYPSYARALQQQFLTLTAIRLEEERYRRLFEESIITREMLNELERDLRRRRKAAERRPALDLGLARDQLVARLPMFAGLPPDRRAAISRLLKPRFAYPGETIIRKGERGDLMYFISSGALEVRLGPDAEPIRLGSGSFVGELALITRRPRNADVVVLGYCQLLSLSRRDLRTLLKTDRALRDQIYAVARDRQSTPQAAA